MPPLPDHVRRLCSYLAVISLVLGIATVPLSVRSAGRPASVLPGFRDVAAATPLPTAVPIHRNPFQGDPPVTARAPQPSPAGVVPHPASVLPTVSVLPVVSALAVGPHPSAILDEAGVPQIRTIGDHVGTHTIVAISLDGVRLDDGTLLPMAGGSESPAPAVHPDAFPPIPIGAAPLPDVRGDTQ